MPCTISQGIPATHHENAVLKPVDRLASIAPINIYGMEQKSPYNSPYNPERILNPTAEFIFLNNVLISASDGHV